MLPSLLQSGVDWVKARQRLRDAVSIWYHPDFSPAAVVDTVQIPNIEPKRGERVIAKLMQDGLLRPADLHRPEPAAVEDLRRFHSFSYLESLSDPEVVGPIFGLRPQEVELSKILRQARVGVGGTIEAARTVVDRPGRIAISLGGGFHHAKPDRGSGFCLYNDVGIAILALRARGFTGRVLIIDLDVHQGDGNSEGFAEDDSVFVYSIHGSEWTEVKSDTAEELLLTGTVGDGRYLECLRDTLPAVIRKHDPQLVFYLAGNDVLGNDRLGGFWLTLEGVLARDIFVIRQLQRRQTPLVVTLAGGYSREAWVASYNMLRYVLADRRDVVRPEEASLSRLVARISRELDPNVLTTEEDEDFSLTEEDVFGSLGVGQKQRRFLGYYTMHGAEVALERYGLLAAVRERDYFDLKLEMDASDPAHEILRLRGRRFQDGPLLLLIEVVLRRQILHAPWESSAAPDRMEMLSVEWMLLQDPSRSFSLSRPPLPGQEHPGLGVSLLTRELFISACKRLGLHGVIDHPAYYHTGWGQAQTSSFLDPAVEGRFLAVRAVLSKLSLSEASRAVADGRVRYGDGSAYEWEPEAQVLPVSKELAAYFKSRAYREPVKAAREAALARGLHLRGEQAPSEAAAPSKHAPPPDAG